MKIAFISAELMSGKSSIIALLAGVYSRSQGKSVSIMSTGSIEDNKDIISIVYENKDLANSYVIKAIFQNGTEDKKDILNYATKQGLEDVYLFDAVPSAITDDEKVEFFDTCISNVPTDLTLIEIAGDVNSEVNQAALEQADACVIIHKPNKRSMILAKELKNALPDKHRGFSSAFLCNEFDAEVIAEKELNKEMNSKENAVLKIPFSRSVRKLYNKSELDKLIIGIIKGDPIIVDARIRMLEIMQWMFDTPQRKVIKEVNRWYN